jgi:hypothetical protein
MSGYTKRVIDTELDELVPHLAAISIDGPKGVGKTATGRRRSASEFRMDDPEDLERVRASPQLLATAQKPTLIDEWQRLPMIWDIVRRAVDSDRAGGQFILTGSAIPANVDIHSGAGRIASLRMRPLSIAERGLQAPSVSLSTLLAGGASTIEGQTSLALDDYVREIVSSGFPALRSLPARPRRAQLDGYLQRVIEREVIDQGLLRRQPAALRDWLRAYASATASTASETTLAIASSPGDANPPARSTTQRYRDVLTQLWLLDPVEAWPAGTPIKGTTRSPKHFLADPALAARLLGLEETRLIDGAAVRTLGPQDHTVLGALFEAIVALSVKVYAQAAEARVYHLRTEKGLHEVDLLVRADDGRTVALEVKLSTAPGTRDARHLHWLKEQLGEQLTDMVIVNTGSAAYRRQDGVAVVPLALLGP